ncbi:MAG: hypothetical protein V3T03_01085, partial [Candidatus Bipolaricaulota bacterium]
PCCGIDVAREPWYQTDIAMYASFEMQDVAPWAEDYADANLASLVLHSSMGVALTGSIAQSSELQLRLLEFAEIAGLPVESIPAVEPLVLEYESGSPRLDNIDRLAWDESSFYKRVTGSSLGMTLLRESQEALQLLGAGPREEKTPADRFYGLVLVDALCKKIDVIEKLTQIMLSHTASAYVPHAFRLTEATLGAGIDILDPRSGLFDQASLLWGLQQTLRVFQDPNVMTLLAETDLFDYSVAQRTADLADSVLQTIGDFHVREGSPSFVDWTTPTPTGWQQDSKLQAVNLSLTIVALAERADETGRAGQLLERAVTVLTDDFLAADGEVTDQIVASDSTSDATDTSARDSLSAELAAIRGLLAAYEQTNDPDHVASAQRIFDDLISGTLHKAYVQTPCGEECYYAGSLLGDGDGDCYSPLDVGLAIGALERLARVSESDRATKIRDVLDGFFEQIVESARLQLPSSSVAQGFGGRGVIIEYFAPVLARRVCYPSPAGK